jgi:hypothetical protein
MKRKTVQKKEQIKASKVTIPSKHYQVAVKKLKEFLEKKYDGVENI